MDWKILFFILAMWQAQSLGGQSSLDWKLIQRFVSLWNHTDQGICIAIPGSTSGRFKFVMRWPNLSSILEADLAALNHTNGGNVTWGIVESPFLEQSGGKKWDENGNWVEKPKALYHLPSNPTWEFLWNQTCYRSDVTKSTQNVTSIPCTIVPWWDPTPGTNYFEHEYNVQWNAEWCIQVPSKPGTPHLMNHRRYEWAWSLKQLFNPHPPLGSISTFPTGEQLEWEVKRDGCDRTISQLPSGGTLCWKIRECRSMAQHTKKSGFGYSYLLNCSRMLNCSTGAGDPFETWYIPELRTFIRDMCTCWGFPNYGYKNQDNRCNSSFSEVAVAQRCGIPTTHGPDQRKIWNPETQEQQVPRGDLYHCENAKYPAPSRTVWACSGGKMYSHLNMYEMAGLTCTIGIPSVCPSRVFNRPKKSCIRKRAASNSKEWISSVQTPNRDSWGKKNEPRFRSIFLYPPK